MSRDLQGKYLVTFLPASLLPHLTPCLQTVSSLRARTLPKIVLYDVSQKESILVVTQTRVWSLMLLLIRSYLIALNLSLCIHLFVHQIMYCLLHYSMSSIKAGTTSTVHIASSPGPRQCLVHGGLVEKSLLNAYVNKQAPSSHLRLDEKPGIVSPLPEFVKSKQRIIVTSHEVGNQGGSVRKAKQRTWHRLDAHGCDPNNGPIKSIYISYFNRTHYSCEV